MQAAVDEAGRRLSEATHTLDRLRFALQAAGEEQQAAERDVETALDRLHESDPAAFAALAPRLRAICGGGESKVARALLDQPIKQQAGACM